MAGIWEPYEPETTQTGLDAFGAGGEGTDEPEARFSILTTEANAFQSTYHHRMPVVLAPGEEQTWLAEADESLLAPYDGDLEAYPVSERVNSPANDDPELVERV
jgi:putative SOS response-associated peptidase YedK